MTDLMSADELYEHQVGLYIWSHSEQRLGRS